VISLEETDRRIRLTHHVVRLGDGHQVGVSVGGRGVPLVFLHGLALDRRTYLRMLSRVAGLGFLVIAIDAAGHGDTRNLPGNAGELADRVGLTLRTLDALGIQHAVVVGHSMGGRMAIQLAALAPQRVLAAVLFDAAAGASLDGVIPALAHSPRLAVRTIGLAAYDVQCDRFRLSVTEHGRYMRTLASVAMRNSGQLMGFAGAARAIMHSGDYTPLLHMMRDQQIPTFVVHGEKDLLVPFESARELAEDADATLYRVPGAYHLWMIANPRQGADALRQLRNRELGKVLRDAAAGLGIRDWRDAGAWDRALIDPDAMVRELTSDHIDELGDDEREHVVMEIVRRSRVTTARTTGSVRAGWIRHIRKRLRAGGQPQAR
jgi:pimeloyl-ACP methyl ester carboxylesterase